MPDLVESIKTAAQQVMDSSQLTALLFGLVISTSPIKIQVDQKLILEKEQLFLARNVTDFQTSVSLSWRTGIGLKDEGYDHSHSVSGGSLTVHNALKVGEKVILIRQSGGQKFIVLDRVVM